MPLRATFSKNLRYQFLILYTLDERFLQAAVEDVTEAVRAGALRVGEDAGVPLHHFPLDQTAAAHDAVEGGAVGKVLIDIAGRAERTLVSVTVLTPGARVGTYRWHRRALAALVGSAVGAGDVLRLPEAARSGRATGRRTPSCPEPQRERLLEMGRGHRGPGRRNGGPPQRLRRDAGAPAPVTHVGHFILTLLTGGLWGFVWLAAGPEPQARTGSATRSTRGATSGRSPPPDPRPSYS